MKLIYFILGLGIFANYSAQTSLDTGLVRNYPFNGNANDVSPNLAYGGAYGATLTTDRFGNPNSAYSFNGSTDYIDFEYESQNGGVLQAEYTYSVWALAQSIPALGTETSVIFIGDMFGSDGGQAIKASNMLTGVYNGWGGYGFNDNNTWPLPKYSAYSNANLVPNVWKHIVITRSANVMTLFIDGILTSVDSTNYATYPFYGFVDPMSLNYSGSAKIGVSHNYSGYFHGKIDDVRIYNRAISNSEVNALYNLPTTLNSLRDFTVSKFNLYPNPASDKAQLHYNLPSTKSVVLNISNLQGQILKSEFLNSNQGAFQLDLSKFDNGVYFYTIVADGEILSTQKLVVTR